MGFLALINEGGILASIGIDIRNETGIIGSLSSFLGIEHSGHIIALLLAHAWFNLALDTICRTQNRHITSTI